MIDDARDHVMKYVLIARSLCRAGPIEECLLFDQIFIEASPTSTEDQHQDSVEECMLSMVGMSIDKLAKMVEGPVGRFQTGQ